MTDTAAVAAEDGGLQQARDSHRSHAARLAEAAAAAETAGDGERAVWLRQQAADQARAADTEDRQLQVNQQRRRAALAAALAHHRPDPATLTR